MQRCYQEEADTLHVNDALKKAVHNILVRKVNIDVIVLLVSIYFQYFS